MQYSRRRSLFGPKFLALEVEPDETKGIRFLEDTMCPEFYRTATPTSFPNFKSMVMELIDRFCWTTEDDRVLCDVRSFCHILEFFMTHREIAMNHNSCDRFRRTVLRAKIRETSKHSPAFAALAPFYLNELSRDCCSHVLANDLFCSAYNVDAWRPADLSELPSEDAAGLREEFKVSKTQKDATQNPLTFERRALCNAHTFLHQQVFKIMQKLAGKDAGRIIMAFY